MSSLVIINGVVYDIAATSETSVCEKCAFNQLNIHFICPRLAKSKLLVCSWLDSEDDGAHYFIKRDVFIEREV